MTKFKFWLAYLFILLTSLSHKKAFKLASQLTDESLDKKHQFSITLDSFDETGSHILSLECPCKPVVGKSGNIIHRAFTPKESIIRNLAEKS